MYPTYEYIKKVLEDSTLTPSQKMHEIFKDSKTTPLKDYIKNDSLFNTHPIDPSFNIEEAELVQVDADGQIVTFRNADNTYSFLDAGSYVEIEGVDHIAGEHLDDLDSDTMNQIFEDLLNTEDSPLTFARGYFFDEDLQKAFLSSYPN